LCGVRAERHLAPVRIDPSAADDQRLLIDQPVVCLLPGLVRVRGVAPLPGRIEVARLEPAGWQLAHVTELAADVLAARHQATARALRRGSGSTVRDATYSARALSGMRTCRPTRTKRI